MPRLQIIILLTILTIFFACKEDNASNDPNLEDPNTEKIDSSFVETPEEVQYYTWVDKLRLRAKPNTKSDVVAELKEGSLLTYLHEKTDFTQAITLRGKAFDEPWYKIKTPDGVIGWVYGGGVLKDIPVVDAMPTVYDKCLEMRSHNFKTYEICMSRTKSRQLKKDKQYVKKLPNKLQFNLLSGEKKILESRKGEEAVSYDYRLYIPQMGYFVVEATYHEGREFILVNDKTGKEIRIGGYPRPAPGYRHLLVTNSDLEAGFEFNGFQIWGPSNSGFQKFMEENMKDFTPVSARWLDKATAEIQVAPDKHQSKLEPRLITMHLQDSGEWIRSEEINEEE